MRILPILVLMLCFMTFVNGQNSKKSFILSGTIYDSVKALVPSTEVIARNKNGRVFKAVSNYAGFYKIYLPFGNYELEFYRNGFKKYTVKNFQNTSESKIKFDVEFMVGHCADCKGALLGERDENEEKPTIVDYLKLKKERATTVKGLITDEMGAVFPFVLVVFKGVSGEIIQTQTDDEGSYITYLPLGVFTISIEVKSPPLLYKNKETKLEVRDFNEKKQDLTLTMYCLVKFGCPVVTTTYCGG